MEMTAFYHPPTFTLTYVVWDPQTKDAVIIDPVLDYDPASGNTNTVSVEALQTFLEDKGLRTHYVLETHAHADHLSASQYLKRATEAAVVIGGNIKTVQETFKGVFGMDPTFATDGSQFDRLVSEGDTITAGSLSFGVIETPGHTPACVCYTIGDAVFTGDALFMEDFGTGRCDFPKGSAADLFDSIQKLYRLPDTTRVFVGHDYQPQGRGLLYETTIGRSKEKNTVLKGSTTREAFIATREARDKGLAAPRLLFPSVQVNIDAGRLPEPEGNGLRYLKMPLNVLRPADAVGKPTS